MNDVIQKLIESGKTPDEIYKEAKKAEIKYQARNEEKRQSDIAKARDNAITSIVNYNYALTGTHLQAAEVKDLEEDFKRVEKLFTKTKDEKKEPKMTREEREREVSDWLNWLWTLS